MDSSDKPLYLFYMIRFLGVTNALVFTKSTDSTARLATLLQCFEDVSAHRMVMDNNSGANNLSSVKARAYSGDLSLHDRKSTLNAFKSGEVHMYVLRA